MSLRTLSRAFSAISSTPPRRLSSAAPTFRRRAPLVGALCILSLGALSAIACRGCAGQCLRRFHLLGKSTSFGIPIYDLRTKEIFLYHLLEGHDAHIDVAFTHVTRPLLDANCIRLKDVNQESSRVLHSTAMEGASTTVPSIVVYVTVPNREAGTKLAKSIITEKLAACVNLVPGIQSVYWWDGKVQTDAEELLIIKTRESLLGALTEHVKSNHEYDVPEVIALPITGGNQKYLEWIKDSTRDK